MLRHLLKTGDLTRRLERRAVSTRTLSEALRDRHKEYANLRIGLLAANEDTLLATKSCDALRHACSQTDRQTDGAEYVTFLANVVGNIVWNKLRIAPVLKDREN